MRTDMGPWIRELQPNRHLVAGDQEGGSWCLALYPTAGRGNVERVANPDRGGRT